MSSYLVASWAAWDGGLAFVPTVAVGAAKRVGREG